MNFVYSPYLPPSKKDVTKLILTFIKDSSLTLELYHEFLGARRDGELGLGQDCSFTGFLQSCINFGDKLHEEIKKDYPRDLYGAQGKTAENLQKEPKRFGEPFCDLVVILWVLKQRLGEKDFSQLWESLLREYPEMKDFFPKEEPTALIPEPNRIREVRPTGRRKIAGKKEVKV